MIIVELAYQMHTYLYNFIHICIFYLYINIERDATCYNPLALCVHLSIDSLAKVYKRLAAKADHRGLMDDNHLSNCG